MKISKKDWQNYIARLRKINDKAADKVANYMNAHDCSTPEGVKQLIDYAHAVATKYGEGAAELSCQMLDAVADASSVYVPAAEPAATATYAEIAKTIYGTLATTRDPHAVGAAVGRSVKLASVDTLQQNALRDGAEWAWIPAGDTCPFCLMLASRGWVRASKKAIKNGHADHIHNNCDCTYCVRYDGETTVEGYDPDVLYEQYANAGDTPRERLNALRRQHYAANKDYINAQKRAAYSRRMTKNMAKGKGERNDWSTTIARRVSKEEKLEIIEYAKKRNVNIVDLSKFDGSKELMKEQIDTLSNLMEKYPLGKVKITILPTRFSDEGQFGGLSPNGRTIMIETRALRNREITISNILSNEMFSAKEPKDIIIHEYGHILGRKYGTNGIEFARSAYYNVFNKNPSDKELFDYIKDNISKKAIESKSHNNGSVTFEELFPELLVKHERLPDNFTNEFIRLMMER